MIFWRGLLDIIINIEMDTRGTSVRKWRRGDVVLITKLLRLLPLLLHPYLWRVVRLARCMHGGGGMWLLPGNLREVGQRRQPGWHADLMTFVRAWAGGLHNHRHGRLYRITVV